MYVVLIFLKHIPKIIVVESKLALDYLYCIVNSVELEQKDFVTVSMDACI